MIIYKDILNDAEMFTDSYKMKVTDDGIFYEVQGNLYSETTKVDDSMFGGNKSAEAPEEEETEETSVSGCSIVVQNRLQEQFGVDKKSYKKYIKLYIAAILKHLKETKPDEVDKFKANAPKAVDRILKAFDEWKFYHGETDFDFDNQEKAEGMLAIMGWKDDIPYMLFFKDGVIEEKAVQLFKMIVRSVLMYGCEAWKLTKTEAKLDGFQYKCMKRILRIRWPQTISHQQIQENTGVIRTSDEIRHRRWNWIGHIIRKDKEEHLHHSSGMEARREKKAGSTQNNLEENEDERKTAGWQPWANVRTLAANRSGWKENVKALCALWHKEI